MDLVNCGNAPHCLSGSGYLKAHEEVRRLFHSRYQAFLSWRGSLPKIDETVPFHPFSTLNDFRVVGTRWKHIIKVMRAVTLIYVLLYAFVAIGCQSYAHGGAMEGTENTKSCHPTQSKESSEKSSLECCCGIPAKSEQRADSIPNVSVSHELVVLNVSIVICAFGDSNESPPPVLLQHCSILRL